MIATTSNAPETAYCHLTFLLCVLKYEQEGIGKRV